MRIGLTTAAALTLIPTAAFAHPGIGDAHGFVAGFAHPLGGRWQAGLDEAGGR